MQPYTNMPLTQSKSLWPEIEMIFVAGASSVINWARWIPVSLPIITSRIAISGRWVRISAWASGTELAAKTSLMPSSLQGTSSRTASTTCSSSSTISAFICIGLLSKEINLENGTAAEARPWFRPSRLQKCSLRNPYRS